MKKLSSVTISGGLTVDQATTLSGVVSVGGIGTGAYTSVLVRNSSNQMLYRNYSDFLNDISGSLNLSGYVPTSRTLTINGTTYDLSANRTWTITTPYVSKLQHTVKAGVAINKGQAVYVTGADGTNMVVGLASNASEATSSKTMGLLDATVSTNGFANVVTEGLLAGLDTSTAGSEGDPVWLGTGGNLIYGLINKPYAPAHLVFIGIVTRKNNSNGEIFVKVQNGFELKEIHDVDLITSAPTAGQLLRYNSDGLWKNWSPNYLTAESDTLASVTGRGATTSTPVTFNGNVTLGNSADLVFQDLAGTFPTSGKGFDWTLNNDGARIYAIQPNSDSIDFVFQLRDNATTNDRFVFWVDEWQGPAYDKYPLIISGGTEFDLKDSSLYTNTVLRLSNSGVLQNVTGNISMFTNNAGYLTSESDTLATVTGRGATTSTNISVNTITIGTDATYGAAYRSVSFGYNGDGSNRIFAANNTSDGMYFAAATGQGFNFRPNGGTANLVVINSAGNVGIDTTSPAQKLDVNGNISLGSWTKPGSTYVGLRRADDGSFGGGGDSGLVIESYNHASPYAGDYSQKVHLRTHLYNGGSHNVLTAYGVNVGIGTTTPNAKLEVVGNTYLRGGALYVDTIAGYTNNVINLAGGANLVLPSGNIGIRVTNPTASLSLGTSSYDNNPLAGLEYSQVTGGGRLDLKVQTWGTGSDYGLTTGLTVLTPGFDTNNVRVGIGTTSPGAKLDVNGTLNTSGQTILASAFRFYSGGSDGSTLYGDFRTNPATGNSIISAKTNALYFNYDHGTGGVIFCNGSSGIVGTVDASGNANFIGAITQNGSQVATTSYVTTQINNLIAGAPGVLDTLDELAAALGDDSNFATTVTNSIATKLPLAGGTMSGTISFVNDIGTALQGTVGINDFWRIYANSTTTNAGYLEIATSDDGTEPIYVRQYTGVFSSLTRTATLLDGAGNTAFPGNLNIGGFLTESSSLKLKENVETSEGNLEKVVNLRPVTYNKIGSQTTELGLIAEEVAEVYPEFVQYDENGEPIGVNYSRLTAALIGAVKELTNQVQELNKKING